MKAYSEDLRQKIVDAIERGMPKAQAARTFGVGISTVKRYSTKAQRGEPLEPGTAPGKRPKMDERIRKLLEEDLKERRATEQGSVCQSFYINGYVRADDCDRGEWAFRDGQAVAFGPQPALVHYEALRERGEPHYV